MMKSFKIIVLAIMFFVLINIIPIPVYASEENHFTGSRHIEFLADKSDVDNFIDGGREAFDLILRSTAPEWLKYHITTENRDIVLDFSFEFSSYDDYCNKVGELLTYDPSILYSGNEDIHMLESYSAIELLNGLQWKLKERECLQEKELADFFQLRTNEIIIGEDLHKGKDRLVIRSQNNAFIKWDALSIDTVSMEDGSYVRNITGKVSQIDNNVKESLILHYENIGEIVECNDIDNQLSILIRLDANSSKELVRKTMLCLDSATNINEKYFYKDEENITVERYEFFDLENLMKKNGVFNYSYSYPEEVKNLTVQNGMGYVSGGNVTSHNVDEIISNYECKLKFSKVEISTRINGFSGKIEKVIKLMIPTDIAQMYHEGLKKEFQNRLVRGSVLNIYDDGDERVYEISIKSFFLDEIEGFTDSILNTSRAIKYKNSWIPFDNNYIRESIDLKNIFSEMMLPEEIIVSYHLPAFSIVSQEELEKNNAQKVDDAIIILSKNFDNIHLEFRSVIFSRLLLEVVIVVGIFICVKKLKRNKIQER